MPYTEWYEHAATLNYKAWAKILSTLFNSHNTVYSRTWNTGVYYHPVIRVLNTVKCTAWGNPMQQLQFIVKTVTDCIYTFYMMIIYCKTCTIVNIFTEKYHKALHCFFNYCVHECIIYMASSIDQECCFLWLCVYLLKVSENFK